MIVLRMLNRAFRSTLAKWKSMPASEILLVLDIHDFGFHSSTCNLIIYSLTFVCLETKGRGVGHALRTDNNTLHAKAATQLLHLRPRHLKLPDNQQLSQPLAKFLQTHSFVFSDDWPVTPTFRYGRPTRRGLAERAEANDIGPIEAKHSQ